MTDAELIAILSKLAVDDPWCHSAEGLDDACLFCDEDYTRRRDGVLRWQWVIVYHHRPDCPWLVAMDALGREHPDHVVCPTPEERRARAEAERFECEERERLARASFVMPPAE